MMKPNFHHANEIEMWTPIIQSEFLILIHQFPLEQDAALFLLPRVLELSPLSNAEAKPQAPGINTGLWQGVGQSPEEGVGPVWRATGLKAYVTQSCSGISICWWNKEGGPLDWCHLCCHIEWNLHPEKWSENINQSKIITKVLLKRQAFITLSNCCPIYVW